MKKETAITATEGDFIKKISERKEKLEYVRKALKEKFIGIDSVIDKIIDNISLWYLTPEIQFRPLIISLWGITGVGKTDLVRTLVNLLDFTDKFIEIQMDSKNEYQRTIESYLESSGVDSNQPSILLLDEIQRYRTINEHGQMIENKYFNDIWMLLSDGKLQSNSQRRLEIMELMLEEAYWEDRTENAEEVTENTSVNSDSDSSKDEPKNEKKKKKEYKFKTSYWTAKRIRKLLDLKMPTDKIMEMTPEERVELMENHLKSNKVNEGKTYEKLLIFISGNLDEAFHMADEVEDVERDADIYHEMSKRITILHIKDALAKKFKPEQIARFGNNHVIYPCLDRKSYYKIIQMNCQKILDRVKEEHGIIVTLDNEIYDTIYRNGVFPTQGVRPAISTVFNVLGSNLPHFLYHALVSGVDGFKLKIEDKCLVTKIKNKTYKKELILDIDFIKEGRTLDEKILILVHEIGHALIYGLLFHTPPQQINVNSSSVFSSGFVITHIAVDNKTFIRNQLAVYLAGLVAEELVFGEDFKSNGASADITTATHAAGMYVRSYAMDGSVSRVMRITTQAQGEFNYNIDESNRIIENILTEEKARAQDLLKKNMKVFKKLIAFTIKNNVITPDDFVRICQENGLTLTHKKMNEKLIYSYDDKLNQFLEN